MIADSLGGLAAQPEVKQDGGRVTLTSSTLKIVFSNADIESHAESVTIRLR